MNIVKKEVKTYTVTAYCECGGNMVLKTVLSAFPAIYVYVCLSCNKEQSSKDTYPITHYEEVK